jgi:hypothetical protein
MSRIPVPSHTRTLQEPISFPQERAVSPAPSSRQNTSMSSLSGHASPAGGKKSKRALGDEVRFHSFSLLVMSSRMFKCFFLSLPAILHISGLTFLIAGFAQEDRE